MKTLILTFLLVFSILLASSITLSQNNSRTLLKGYVKTTQGQPIPAEIIISNRSKILKTNEEGLYDLPETEPYYGELSLLLLKTSKFVPFKSIAKIRMDSRVTCNFTIDDLYILAQTTETFTDRSSDGLEKSFLKLAAFTEFSYTPTSIGFEIRGIQNQFLKRLHTSNDSSQSSFLFLHPGFYEIKAITAYYIKPITVEILPHSITTCEFHVGKRYN